jgi:cell division septation protein DedD
MKLVPLCRFSSCKLFLAIGLAVTFSASPASSQVSPSEILNPDLRALEESYFQQLKSINQSIAKTKFPFPLYLSRYVGLDPAHQAEADSRGLEFVRFQDRAILKVTGNYNAAYDTTRLNRNERAAATFRTVVLPILEQVTAVLPKDLACDGIGFEISHHTHTKDRTYDYEGKEILVVVLDREDAWALSLAATDRERQEIVNRSKVYVSGAEFGLSLLERDPLNVQGLPRSVPAKPDSTSTARSSTLAGRSSLLNSNLPPAPVTPTVPAPEVPAPPSVGPVLPGPKTVDAPPASPPPTQADADRLDARYQVQLAAFAKQGAAKFHFVDYAPPTFVVFHDQMALQLTLRNSIQFGPGRGSIYKRAAQSFDLFLAPLLKDLSDRISPDLEFQLYDFSVLNKLSPGPKGTSEAIEFICPRTALRQFVNAEITNQQLLDQSFILVNGVRIALNLQLVE